MTFTVVLLMMNLSVVTEHSGPENRVFGGLPVSVEKRT
jgi:hypothetical protein